MRFLRWVFLKHPHEPWGVYVGTWLIALALVYLLWKML